MALKAEVLTSYKKIDEVYIDTLLKQEIEKNNKKIVVLDDDPTGVQTVHDISVYTNWEKETIRQGFEEKNNLFYILTNSRGFTAEKTTAAHNEISAVVDEVARETGREYIFISRSDSTLRGHYPLETEILKANYEKNTGKTIDGEILCPFFKEGGRFTIDDVHYVKYGDKLIPANETEFAKDKTFGYTAATMPEYIEEKTKGTYKAENVTCISLEDIHNMDIEKIENLLMNVQGFNKIIVNAVDYADIKVFCVALYRAMAKGKVFMFRTAAAIVKVMGGVSDQPLLTRQQMVTKETDNGGIIVVGSHTDKTTRQVEELKKLTDIEFIELNATLGALIGLAVAIFLIVKKVEPAYSMIAGAFVGGVIGGAGIEGTVTCMVTGTQGIMPAILRIVTSGVLAGILIQSGAAVKIADQIIRLFGEKRALFSLALATMILTAVGVFGDVAVITVAPIAMVIGQRIGCNNFILLAALMGGEKAGMVISPNPNTIAAAETFGVDLSALMAANIIPAIVGLAGTVIICKILSGKNKSVNVADKTQSVEVNTQPMGLPSIWASIVGPLIAVVLLMLRPICGITIDPLVALPAGAIIGLACMRKMKHLGEYISYGLGKMMPVAILLIGTGTISGIIKTSQFQVDMTTVLNAMNLPAFLLAPISGIVMAGATASSSAGATIASATFSGTITQIMPALYGAAMLHAGTIVLDSLPHGSIFHASAGAMGMPINERIKLLPIDILEGFIIVLASTIIYGIIL